MTLERVTVDDAKDLLSLPRSLGPDPSDGVEVLANNGRYGPYVQKGKDFRNIDNEEKLLTITIDDASKIFSLPKVFKRGGANMAAKGPLREFGDDPASGKAVVAKDGKFGVYVTDGETNASLSKGDRLDAMPPERAYELLAIRREAIIEKGGAPAKKIKAAAKKAPAAKKSAAKKSAAKKPAAR
jgi:DNA topoisomerase-1